MSTCRKSCRKHGYVLDQRDRGRSLAVGMLFEGEDIGVTDLMQARCLAGTTLYQLVIHVPSVKSLGKCSLSRSYGDMQAFMTISLSALVDPFCAGSKRKIRRMSC
jgi:hypothetical protein